VSANNTADAEAVNEALQSDCDCRQWAFQFLQPRAPAAPSPALGDYLASGEEDEEEIKEEVKDELTDELKEELTEELKDELKEELKDELEEELEGEDVSEEEDLYSDEVETTTHGQIVAPSSTTTTRRTSSARCRFYVQFGLKFHNRFCFLLWWSNFHQKSQKLIDKYEIDSNQCHNRLKYFRHIFAIKFGETIVLHEIHIASSREKLII
jgi:hypothetical protein